MDTRSLALTAFQSIIPVYQEVVSIGGGLGVDDSPNGPSATRSSAIVQACDSDFICDVDISARRALTSKELWYFNQFYKSGQLLLSDTEYEHSGFDVNLENFLLLFKCESRAELAEMDNNIRHKLGQRLIDAKIYPLRRYFTPVDTRVPKR